MKKTVALLFSMNRAMQCDLAIESLKLHCLDLDRIDLKVLYKTTDERHEKAYQTLIEKNPKITFIKEEGFETNLWIAIMDYTYAFFIVDDTVFTKDFRVFKAEKLLLQENILGFSYRLGLNCTYCYPVDKEQKIPDYKIDKNILLWDWKDKEFDWGYPLEVSSSIYRVDDMLRIINAANFFNPNQFEFVMDKLKEKFYEKRPMMSCYKKSVAFANPINKIKEDNQNRVGIKEEHSIASLLTSFENGGRINPLQFSNIEVKGCHQEMDFIIG